MKSLTLTNSEQVILVDDEDYKRCKKITWYLVGKGYAQGYFGSELVYLHRFILWMFDDDKRHVDHEDGNTFNCQKYNLRPCNKSQNMGNSKKRNYATSKYKGVSYTSRGQWLVQIQKRHVGLFTDEKEAAQAYNMAAQKEFGEFAKLNVLS